MCVRTRSSLRDAASSFRPITLEYHRNHPVIISLYFSPGRGIVLLMDSEQNANGFRRGDQTCFNRLPEQIREHYPNLHHFGQVWLDEAHAVLEFYPGGDRDEMHTHFWEKTTSGWVLVKTQGGEY